jgi:hypothetical protein
MERDKGARRRRTMLIDDPAADHALAGLVGIGSGARQQISTHICSDQKSENKAPRHIQRFWV